MILARLSMNLQNHYTKKHKLDQKLLTFYVTLLRSSRKNKSLATESSLIVSTSPRGKKTDSREHFTLMKNFYKMEF